MYTVVFESFKTPDLDISQEEGVWLVNGIEASIDIHEISPYFYNLIIDGKSINLEIVQSEKDGKKIFKLKGKKVSAEARTALDKLLDKMGMNKSQLESVKEIKAPMPGLILEIITSAGKTIKKGDPLLILEAMKMENVIKSPIDGTIKKLFVKENESVAKNQVLIEF